MYQKIYWSVDLFETLININEIFYACLTRIQNKNNLHFFLVNS